MCVYIYIYVYHVENHMGFLSTSHFKISFTALFVVPCAPCNMARYALKKELRMLEENTSSMNQQLTEVLDHYLGRFTRKRRANGHQWGMPCGFLVDGPHLRPVHQSNAEENLVDRAICDAKPRDLGLGECLYREDFRCFSCHSFVTKSILLGF